jgi:cysteine-rich repeat protein
MLATAQVPVLTTAPLAERFRYVAIPPTPLEPGQRYIVAALYHQNVIEWWAEGGEDVRFDPRLTFDGGREQYQVTALQIPSQTEEAPRFGPSLLLVGQCGDGVADGGEDCDDGNDDDTDGCSTACVADTPTPTASPTETPTETATPTRSATATGTSTAAATATTTRTVTATAMATAQATATMSPDPRPTRTRSPSPTEAASPTATASPPPACAGDCSGDGFVRIEELILAVNIALDRDALDGCRAGDRNGDGRITVDELVASVSRALSGCGGA